jgi:hypothetical protein
VGLRYGQRPMCSPNLPRERAYAERVPQRTSDVMSADLLLMLNAGSSTVKIALFEVAPSGTRRAAKGLIDFRGIHRAYVSRRALQLLM